MDTAFLFDLYLESVGRHKDREHDLRVSTDCTQGLNPTTANPSPIYIEFSHEA